MAVSRPIPPDPTATKTSPGSMPGRFTEWSAMDAVSHSAARSYGIESGIRAADRDGAEAAEDLVRRRRRDGDALDAELVRRGEDERRHFFRGRWRDGRCHSRSR